MFSLGFSLESLLWGRTPAIMCNSNISEGTRNVMERGRKWRKIWAAILNNWWSSQLISLCRNRVFCRRGTIYPYKLWPSKLPVWPEHHQILTLFCGSPLFYPGFFSPLYPPCISENNELFQLYQRTWAWKNRWKGVIDLTRMQSSYNDLSITNFSPDYSMYITTLALLVKDSCREFSWLFPCNKNRELKKIFLFH